MNGESESSGMRASRTRGRIIRRTAQYMTAAVVVLAAVLIGGAPPTIQVALSAGALLATAAWMTSRRGEFPLVPFASVAVVALAGTLVQLIPLPHELVAALSPRAAEIRAEATGRRPAFLPLTLDVPATVLAALRGFACLGILLVTAKATRWRGRSALFAVTLSIAGGLIGVLSLGQRLFDADTILGIYRVKDMPGSGFFGTFVNGNHAASFFSLSALVGIGCLRESEGPVKLGVGLSVLVSMVVVFTTGSRMGLLGLTVGLLALAACWLVERLGRNKGLLVAGGVTAVVGPLALLMAISLRRKIDSGALTGVWADQKVRGWKAALGLAGDFPWTGVGRGAFEGPAAAFRQQWEGVRLVHPENLLMQMLSEWGIPLTVALVVLFALPAIRVARRLTRWEPVFQGAACGVLAVLVHELADFGLEIPGVAFPTAMALGLCAGRMQSSLQASSASPSPERRSAPRWTIPVGALAVWAVLLLAGVWAAPRTSEAEGAQAAVLSRDPGGEAALRLAEMVKRHPAEYYFELLAARQAMAAGTPDALRRVNRALRLFPGSPAPHLMASHQLARLGLRTQAAVEYRLAVERGQPFNYDQIVKLVGPQNVLRAVPQTTEDLMNLANAFMLAGRRVEAEEASGRAVDLAEGREAARIRRLEIALTSRDRDFIQKAAVELGRMASTARGLELAAEGLAIGGDLPGARKLLEAGMTANPADGDMPVRAARILFTHGDADGARQLLGERMNDALPLPARIAAEELLAEIALKQGHPEAAAAARVRARLLGRMRGAAQAAPSP